MIYTNFTNIKAKVRLPVKDKLTTFKKVYSNAVSQSSLITYSNVYLDKAAAINRNKGKSCIYKWINKVNNKAYIGSSLDLGRRFMEYYSYSRISNEKRKFPMYNALLNYGYSGFKLEIL